MKTGALQHGAPRHFSRKMAIKIPHEIPQNFMGWVKPKSGAKLIRNQPQGRRPRRP